MKRAILLLCCMTLCAAASSSAFGQEAEDAPKAETGTKEKAVPKDKSAALKDKRITITMEAQPLGVVFRYLMENYDIPIGFEESAFYRFEDGDELCFEGSIRQKNRGGDGLFRPDVQRPAQ